jgi:uncharacterized membrane protein YccC
MQSMFAAKKNTKLMIKTGYVFLLAFFLMNLLPHTPIRINEDVFDGIHGMLLGVAMTLLLWATYLNGKARRAARRD